ncbi:MAG: hypothetical protein RL186_157, partial [Pseudomonadota bacterium]
TCPKQKNWLKLLFTMSLQALLILQMKNIASIIIVTVQKEKLILL